MSYIEILIINQVKVLILLMSKVGTYSDKIQAIVELFGLTESNEESTIGDNIVIDPSETFEVRGNPFKHNINTDNILAKRSPENSAITLDEFGVFKDTAGEVLKNNPLHDKEAAISCLNRMVMEKETYLSTKKLGELIAVTQLCINDTMVKHIVNSLSDFYRKVLEAHLSNKGDVVQIINCHNKAPGLMFNDIAEKIRRQGISDGSIRAVINDHRFDNVTLELNPAVEDVDPIYVIAEPSDFYFDAQRHNALVLADYGDELLVRARRHVVIETGDDVPKATTIVFYDSTELTPEDVFRDLPLPADTLLIDLFSEKLMNPLGISADCLFWIKCFQARSDSFFPKDIKKLTTPMSTIIRDDCTGNPVLLTGNVDLQQQEGVNVQPHYQADKKTMVIPKLSLPVTDHHRGKWGYFSKKIYEELMDIKEAMPFSKGTIDDLIRHDDLHTILTDGQKLPEEMSENLTKLQSGTFKDKSCKIYVVIKVEEMQMFSSGGYDAAIEECFLDYYHSDACDVDYTEIDVSYIRSGHIDAMVLGEADIIILSVERYAGSTIKRTLDSLNQNKLSPGAGDFVTAIIGRERYIKNGKRQITKVRPIANYTSDYPELTFTTDLIRKPW